MDENYEDNDSVLKTILKDINTTLSFMDVVLDVVSSR